MERPVESQVLVSGKRSWYKGNIEKVVDIGSMRMLKTARLNNYG